MQLVELCGQDEHEVAVGVTPYTLSAEQWCRLQRRSSVIRTINSADWAIMTMLKEDASGSFVHLNSIRLGKSKAYMWE